MTRQPLDWSDAEHVQRAEIRATNGRRPPDGAVRLPNDLLDRIEEIYCQLTGCERTGRRPRGFGGFVAELIEYGLESVANGSLKFDHEPVQVVETRLARK